jgi:hypoxanthine phosphoribosyltransferase
MEDNVQVIVTKEEIAARVRELADEIKAAYAGQDLTVVGLLEDSFVFLADLVRAIDAPLQCCFLKASVHQTGGHTDIIYTTEFDPHGTNILLVGGILDTGVTLDYIARQINARGAKSVKACVLVDKPDFRTTEVTPEFVGFKRSEERIMGYGLGIGNSYRYLPHLAVLAQP